MARPLEFDRCQAIQKAREVFHRSGYEAASIDDLTHAIGISRASLYNTFGDKHGLLIATLDAACEEGRQLSTDTRSRRCSSKRSITELFEKLAASDEQGCYLLTLGAELSTSDPEVQSRVKTALEHNRAMFSEILARDGTLTPKQIASKASVLVGLMVSILTLRRVHPDPMLLRGVIQQAISILD